MWCSLSAPSGNTEVNGNFADNFKSKDSEPNSSCITSALQNIPQNYINSNNFTQKANLYPKAIIVLAPAAQNFYHPFIFRIQNITVGKKTMCSSNIKSFPHHCLLYQLFNPFALCRNTSNKSSGLHFIAMRLQLSLDNPQAYLQIN